MATLTVTGDYCGFLQNHDSVYATVQAATQSDLSDDIGIAFRVGQATDAVFGFNIFRALLFFDISALPRNADITAVSLRMYGSDDESDTNFDVTVVSHTGLNPITNDDFSKIENTTFGSINTSGASVGGFNAITLNSTGIANVISQTRGNIRLGVVSSRDISVTQPSGDEFFEFVAWNDASNKPQLVITYSVAWSTGAYPQAPTFPENGVMDLSTYSMIREYLTGLTIDAARLVDENGNITLDTDKFITWTGGEKISYDAGNDWIEFTSLEATTGLALAGNLISTDVDSDTDVSGVDSDVSGDLIPTDASYAGFQTDVPDNDPHWSVGSGSSPSAGQSVIFMDTSTGDFRIKRIDEIIKTDILGDFSAM